MPRVIIGALLLLAAFAYAVLFTTWNMEPVKVVGWRMGSQELWESIPLAYVTLAGVAVGVVAMVIATFTAWLGQRAQLKKMKAQIDRAKEVLEEQRKRIEELEAALAETQKQLEAARAEAQGVEETTGEEEVEILSPAGADEEQLKVGETVSSSDAEGVEDDEVI